MPSARKHRGSYVVRGLLAGAVLYLAFDLSAANRGVVDYVVLSLLVLAILWNVIQLTRRVHAVGGGRSVWHVQRTVLFWIVGLMNSVLIRPELAGSWRNYVGWGMLALAVFDTVLLFRSERRAIAMQVVAETGQPVPERE